MPPLSDPLTLSPLPLPSPALPISSLPARYAFSQAIARSTALSALESSLEIFLQSVALLPNSLSETGRPSLGRKVLIKKLGELLRFRQGANLNRENFGDTPDFYWTEPVLEGVSSNFDVLVDMNQCFSRLLPHGQRCVRNQSSHRLCQ